jgi:hypothetical protein
LQPRNLLQHLHIALTAVVTVHIGKGTESASQYVGVLCSICSWKQKTKEVIEFKVFTAVIVRYVVIWVVTSCSLKRGQHYSEISPKCMTLKVRRPHFLKDDFVTAAVSLYAFYIRHSPLFEGLDLK